VLDLNTEAGPTFQSYPNTNALALERAPRLSAAAAASTGQRAAAPALPAQRGSLLLAAVRVPLRRRSPDTVTSSPYADLAANPNMVGLGITPEAIDQDMRDFDAFLCVRWGGVAPALGSSCQPAPWLHAIDRRGGRVARDPPQTRRRGSR